MARTTSIDVARVDLIKVLKDKLKSIPQAEKEYEKALKEHNAEVKAWAEKLVLDPSNFKEVSLGYRQESINVELTKKALSNVPKMSLERPDFTGYAVKQALSDIQNTLNILELSKSEFVGVSVLNKVSQYL